MTEFSILEIGFYLFLELLSFSMLVISVIKKDSGDDTRELIKSIFLIPGIIAAGIMTGSGEDVTFGSVSTTIHNLNTTETWTQSDSTTVILINPVWLLVHWLIMIVLIIYIIIQILKLFTKVR